MPTLYLFAISHFCEKARWALDYHGIKYSLVHLPPGAHMRWARRTGLPATTLPTLKAGDHYIQGSSDIIDWADTNGAGAPLLTPRDSAADGIAVEQRCDDIIGVHTRRMFYSEALIKHPETVKAVFLADLKPAQKIATTAIWPVLRKMMISKMDIGIAQGEASKKILESELDWLDGLYADGRRFLLEDRFTRADLTVASLLSRIAAPPEHPGADRMKTSPGLAPLLQRWQSRPTIERVRQNYREFRNAHSGC